MARKISAFDGQIIHPAVSISLLAALIAATFAIISALCAGIFWRKESSPESSSPKRSSETENAAPNPEETVVVPPPSPSTTAEMESGSENSTPEVQLPLKLPPARQLKESASYHIKNDNVVAETGHHQKRYLSMKARGSFSITRNFSKREDGIVMKKEKLFKEQDSVWKNQIILGEKCRVPPDEDDTVIYDDRGNKVTAYYPRTKSSQISRSNSYIDPEAVPS